MDINGWYRASHMVDWWLGLPTWKLSADSTHKDNDHVGFAYVHWQNMFGDQPLQDSKGQKDLNSDGFRWF